MEIPPDILQVLKCSVCETYLSRGPVYLQHDGAAVCGVCYSPQRPATRNDQYEATAKLLLYPCKNRDLGCQAQVPFLQEAEANGHEEVCQHHKNVCPILGFERCDWVGSNVDILKHCEEQHVNKVKDNPVTLRHDISKSSEHTFLLRAFQEIFLLHVKICITSGKIFHAIRYLGRSDRANDFTFYLNIKRGDEQFMKKHRVAPQGRLSVQEDTSLTFNINSLLDILGGYDGTTFTVTVEQLASALEKCAKCYALLTLFSYRGEDGWWCGQCTPKINCKHKDHNCTYEDIPIKCKKHEWLFCGKSDYCSIKCCKTVTRGSLHAHYFSDHKIENSGSTWRAKWSNSFSGTYSLILSAAGIGLYKYWLDNSKLRIFVYIPVLSEQLHEYKCVVRITQTATGHTKTYTPDAIYDDQNDWCVEVKKNEFTDWSHEFDVCVDITKI